MDMIKYHCDCTESFFYLEDKVGHPPCVVPQPPSRQWLWHVGPVVDVVVLHTTAGKMERFFPCSGREITRRVGMRSARPAARLLISQGDSPAWMIMVHMTLVRSPA